MLGKPKTILTFDQAGGMKVDAIGYTGKVCAETTDKLLKGLRMTKNDESKKPEFNRTASVSAGVSARG